MARHLFAPSLTFTVLRLVDLRVEGWYEMNPSHYDAGGAYYASEYVQVPQPYNKPEVIRSDDFSYALQVTLNLAELIRKF